MLEAEASMNAGDSHRTVFKLGDMIDGGIANVICPSGAEWIRTPAELGGEKVYILAKVRCECPKCTALVETYLMQNGLVVYNCGACKQFFWCRQ